MENTEFENLKIRYLELTSLFETNKILNASLDLRAILNNLLLTSMGRLMIGQGVVFIRDEKSLYKIAAAKGFSPGRLGQTFFVETALETPLYISEMPCKGDQFCQFLKENNLQIVVPIISNGRLIGILGFGKKFIQSDYKPEEIDFLQSLADSAAIAVDKSLLFDELKKTNRKLDKKIQELNTLFEISRELNATLEIQKIVNVLSFTIMGELLINKCLIILYEKGLPKIKVIRGVGIKPEPVEENLNNPEVQYDFLQKPVHQLGGKILSKHGLSALREAGIEYLVSMTAKNELKGLIGIGRKITGEELSETELGFLETLANDAVNAIENGRMVEQMLEKQRMEEELKIARDIQQRLLPDSFPQLEWIEIAAVNHSCHHVGGDSYDCIALDSGDLGISIADVSGKSTPAALLMANLQASLRALAIERKPVHECVGRINHLIYQNTASDKYITFFYGELSALKKTLTYTNAGHNAPILFHRDGRYRFLQTGGIILGMMNHVAYEEETVPLNSGDVLVLYTDGITEALNAHEEEFGEERLIQVIKENRTASAQETVDRIIAAVESFSEGMDQADDMTLIVVRLKEI